MIILGFRLPTGPAGRSRSVRQPYINHLEVAWFRFLKEIKRRWPIISLGCWWGHQNQDWLAFKFPQEIKTPLDGVLSASCLIPIRNLYMKFRPDIHLLAEKTPSNGGCRLLIGIYPWHSLGCWWGHQQQVLDGCHQLPGHLSIPAP